MKRENGHQFTCPSCRGSFSDYAPEPCGVCNRCCQCDPEQWTGQVRNMTSWLRAVITHLPYGVALGVLRQFPEIDPSKQES